MELVYADKAFKQENVFLTDAAKNGNKGLYNTAQRSLRFTGCKPAPLQIQIVLASPRFSDTLLVNCVIPVCGNVNYGSLANEASPATDTTKVLP